MSNFESLRQSFPDYAKDIKLNLSSVLKPEGAPGLSETQIWAVAVATAFATKQSDLIAAITSEASSKLSPAEMNGAKAAATIMAMNNIYYRFLHLVENPEYGKMPANLRMTVIGNSGLSAVDFELASLAVSAINGCGMCVASHEQKLRQHDVTAQAVQSAVRIAATMNAAGNVLASAGNDLGNAAAAA